MTSRVTLLTAILLLSCLASTAGATDNVNIRICGDRDPLSMAVDTRVGATGDRPQKLIGFSVDMIRAVFSSLGKNVSFISNLPWKRCLNEVESGNIDFAMDAYFDLDRAKIFDYTTHYNTLTPQIFFLASHPVDFSRLANLKHFRGCGVQGTSYTHYGMKPEELDLGIDRDSLFRKMNAQHCDYFLEELEDIASYQLIGIDHLNNPALRHETVSWAVAPSKFLITVKNGKNAALIEKINAAIYTIIKSGQAEQYWKKTKIGIPYKP